MKKKHVNEKEAAAILGLSHRALSNWRWLGQGPKYTKLGSSVRYAEDDLLAFVEENMVNPQQEIKRPARPDNKTSHLVADNKTPSRKTSHHNFADDPRTVNPGRQSHYAPAMREVLDVIDDTNKPVSYDDLSTKLNKSKEAVRKIVTRLLDAGAIRRAAKSGSFLSTNTEPSMSGLALQTNKKPVKRKPCKCSTERTIGKIKSAFALYSIGISISSKLNLNA